MSEIEMRLRRELRDAWAVADKLREENLRLERLLSHVRPACRCALCQKVRGRRG